MGFDLVQFHDNNWGNLEGYQPTFTQKWKSDYGRRL
jgi:hypothetical protein